MNDKNQPDMTKIQLRFLDGPKSDQIFKFSSSTGIIKIGRISKCDIRFDDTALSRI